MTWDVEDDDDDDEGSVICWFRQEAYDEEAAIALYIIKTRLDRLFGSYIAILFFFSLAVALECSATTVYMLKNDGELGIMDQSHNIYAVG